MHSRSKSAAPKRREHPHIVVLDEREDGLSKRSPLAGHEVTLQHAAAGRRMDGDAHGRAPGNRVVQLDEPGTPPDRLSLSDEKVIDTP